MQPLIPNIGDPKVRAKQFSVAIKRLEAPETTQTDKAIIIRDLESQKELLTPSQLFRFIKTKTAQNPTQLLSVFCMDGQRYVQQIQPIN